MAGSDVFVLTIAGLGDSTTAGTPGFFSPSESPPVGKGDPESQYGYWIEKARPEWRFLNRGVRGQRTDQILKRFDREVASQHPDVVIVLAGVNDLYQGYPAEQVEENLSRIYQKARDHKIRLMVCTILPYDISTPEVQVRMDRVNSWIKKEAQKNKYLFCDTFKALEDPKNPHRLIGTPDQIHPDIAGYRKMGQALLKALEEQL